MFFSFVAGGRLSQESAYTMKWLGEGSGTTYEMLIQTPRGGNSGAGNGGGGVLTASSLLQHFEAVKAATRLSVEVSDVYVYIYGPNNRTFWSFLMTVSGNL